MDIPYVFIAGNTAKASEMNTNFSEVATAVTSLEDNQAIIQSNISNLANINGDESEVFNVADAQIDTNNAVNIKQMTNYIAPLKGCIYKSLIQKPATGSLVINISEGTMLDTSGKYIINVPVSQIDCTNYEPGINYYIFAVGDGSNNIGSYKVNTNMYVTLGVAQRIIGVLQKQTLTTFASINMIGTRVNNEEVINVL